MFRPDHLKSARTGAIVAVLAIAAVTAGAQGTLPNPYHEVPSWAKLPATTKWAGVISVDPASNGDVWVFLAQARQQLKAVELRHDDICDDDQRRELINPLQRVKAIGGSRGLVAPACHQLAQAVSRRLFVIDNQHPLIRHRKRV